LKILPAEGDSESVGSKTIRGYEEERKREKKGEGKVKRNRRRKSEPPNTPSLRFRYTKDKRAHAAK